VAANQDEWMRYTYIPNEVFWENETTKKARDFGIYKAGDPTIPSSDLIQPNSSHLLPSSI